MTRAKKAALVIGGSGFIGSAVCARLVNLGWEVHTIVRATIARRPCGVHYHVGDMTERGLVEPLLRKCRTIIHTASATTPGSSSRSPIAELRGNLEPTLRFLEIARDSAPASLVFLSSGGTLYADAVQPSVEDVRPCARSYHGAGKIALEAFCLTFASDTGSRVVVLRPSNVYGPGQSLRRGFGFVRVALDKALRLETIEIWGDGSAVRDFLYIDDLVDAVTAAVADEVAHGVLNVGSGKGRRLSEVLELVKRVTGCHLNVAYRPGRKSDVHSAQMDISRIREVLSWQPAVDLQEGLARTWAWVRLQDLRRDS